MEGLTIQRHVQIVRIYYENSSSVRSTFRALCSTFGLHSRPSERAIHRLINEFESTGSVADLNKPTRQRRARSTENIAAEAQSVHDDH